MRPASWIVYRTYNLPTRKKRAGRFDSVPDVLVNQGMNVANIKSRRKGTSIAYVCVIMSALLGISTLAVDFGRVQLAKTQMHLAVDAASRAAVIGLVTSSSQARTDGKAVALQNLVDGTGLTLTNADILVGNWNVATSTFTSGGSPSNAVRVNGQRSYARGTAVPLLFASFLGRTGCNVNATATCYRVAAINSNTTIPADSNPWLAGCPNNTKANVGSPGAADDKAPAQSPVQMSGITLQDGMALTFDGVSGTGSNDPSNPTTGPDGDSGWIGTNWKGTENGMSSLKAPMNSLIGVFLDATSPIGKSAPSMLDFTSAASRDFNTLSPELRQPFFIGDGKDSNGVRQTFYVPTGATRLFLCSMDEYEWNNNSGQRVVTVNKPQIVSLVE